MLCGSCLSPIRIAGGEEKDVGHRKNQEFAHLSIKGKELVGSNKSPPEEESIENETRIDCSIRVFILLINMDNFRIGFRCSEEKEANEQGKTDPTGSVFSCRKIKSVIICLNFVAAL